MSAATPRPCANGCRTRARDGGERRPIPAEESSRLCRFCESRLERWLREIPQAYALLPYVIDLGSVDRNPESKRGKRAHPPAPLRTAVSDLLDARQGQRVGAALAALCEAGSDPHSAGRSSDWRGTIGLLVAWGLLVRERRNIAAPATITVSSEAAFLLRHRFWISDQDWVSDFYDEVGVLHRDLADAVGDYRPRPVGRCHVVGDDGKSCGGPLMSSDDDAGGVHCARCGNRWSHGHLRHLGLTLVTEEGVAL